MQAPGATDAAVLLPLFGHPERPGLVFTERRLDLRRHAGEISFPGRPPGPPDEDAAATRPCARPTRRSASSPDEVEVVGALPPVGTFVTGYKVHPFVGTDPRGPPLPAQPERGRRGPASPLDQLRAGFAMRRLVRRGVPFRTPTYEVGEHMIWGATARILSDFLERLGGSRRSSAL